MRREGAPAAPRRVVLVTGAARGLGLALAHVVLEDPEVEAVLLGARDVGSSSLRRLCAQHPGRALTFSLDDGGGPVPDQLAAVLRDVDGVDVVVNSAATKGGDVRAAPGGAGCGLDVTPEDLTATFEVNVTGPLRVVQCVQTHLRVPGSVIVNVSSLSGSLRLARETGGYAYAVSKAALNMLTRKLDAELEGTTVVSWTPGWIRTDMGGPDAPASAAEAAADLWKLLSSGAGPVPGAFLSRDGGRLPW